MKTLRCARLPRGLDRAALAAAAWARGDEVQWLEGGGHDELARDSILTLGRPLAVVEGDGPGALDDLTKAILDAPRVVGEADALARFPFRGGAIGYLTYECNEFFERVPVVKERLLGFPRLRWTVPSSFVVSRMGESVFCQVGSGDSAGFERARDEVLRLAETPSASGAPAGETSVKLLWPRERYLTSVEAVREHIYAGDIYQANLSQPFEARGTADPFQVHESLLTAHPTPFAAFLGFGERAVASASPELFLRRRGLTLETRPIKGTRPRTGDPSLDAKALDALDKSEKDRAEIAMIVDLERNDLSRVCRAGTVEVVTARALEAYATVFHGVATIRGQLRAGVGVSEILAATFPSGSITGCPKIRAMEILHGLEREPRGVNFGAIGWIGYDGDLDLSVAIRTISFERNHGVWNATFRTGGGIVADSRAWDEYQESLVKARALARALGDPHFTTHGQA